MDGANGDSPGADVMMKKLRLLILGAFAALILALAPAFAQGNGETLPRPLSGWQVDLERIEEVLKRPGRDDAALVKLRQEIENIRSKARDHVRTVRKEYDDVTTQLNKLGPAPKEEEPPESEAAAKLRAEITAKAAQLDGLIKAAEVIYTRASQLSGTVQSRRRALFSKELFRRVDSPLNPDVWSLVARYAGEEWQRLSNLVGDRWKGSERGRLLLGLAILVAGILWIALHRITNLLITRYRRYDLEETPPFLIRAASAGAVALARALPPILSVSALVLGLWSFGMLHGIMEALALAILRAVVVVAALLALIQTILAPNQPRWRILPASNRDAKKLRWLGWGVVGVFGLDLLLTSMANFLFAPITLTMAQSFVTTTVVALLMAAMLRIRFRPDAAEPRPESSRILVLVRLVLTFLVAAILVAAVLGYVALARFLTTQIVVNGSILLLLYLLHILIEELSASLADPGRRLGAWLARNFALQPQGHARAAILTSTILHILLLLAVVPLFALQWGFDWEDVRSNMSRLLFGFELGGWRVSLATILAAILLFIAGLLLTRFMQRWLDNRVLERAHFETGARSAIRTTVGYIGITIAALIAVAYAGLDFSNVAIVAGALSVGIGFGLQSIVNNFVSGLILLAEQRISVGDWIIVGEEEGHVRRISVRATEIETFDRNFVIIPNSELISSSVKNWTFQHRRARLIINVGVSYDSDPEQVKEILFRVAEEHPATTDQERTRVLFQDFGDSALIFQLRAYVADVSNLIDARSELRFAIMKEFREAGIEIPFPQRDLHLKDIGRLEAAIGGKAPRKRAARKKPA